MFMIGQLINANLTTIRLRADVSEAVGLQSFETPQQTTLTPKTGLGLLLIVYGQ